MYDLDALERASLDNKSSRRVDEVMKNCDGSTSMLYRMNQG